MASKKRISRDGFTFFQPPGPDDPVGSFMAILANKAANYGVQSLTNKIRDKMGIKTTEDPTETRRMHILMQRQQAETARAQTRQQIAEKQLRMAELKLLEKQASLEQAKHRSGDVIVQQTDLSVRLRTELVTGTLGVTATADGISGLVEEEDVYQDWLKRIAGGGEVLFCSGKRGSGKTAFIAKISECVMAIHNIPTCWIGLPKAAQSMAPSWVIITDSPETCPSGHLVICDEAGLSFLSLNFRSERNLFMRRLLMTCRQKNCSLLFAAQNSRDVEFSIIRLANTIAFKEPSLNQIGSERPELRSKVKQAAQVFNEIPKADRVKSALIFDDDFQGLVKSTLPSFWTDQLSHIYSHVDLTSLDTTKDQQQQLTQHVSEELSNDTVDKEIMKLRRNGYSYIKIAQTVGCTVWRVRKTLEDRPS